MRLLILSDYISHSQRGSEPGYTPPHDVDLVVGDLNDSRDFDYSVFDYDVAIVHITPGTYNSIGYFENMPNLLRDSKIALDQGRSIICIPQSKNFRPEKLNQYGDPVYDWVRTLGVELQDNSGQNIKPSGAGLAEVVKEYLKLAPEYYQIVVKPEIIPQRRLAVVDDTDIVVGLEHQVGNGTLVILPPPMLGGDHYFAAMMRLVDVARRYYGRAQRRIPIGDVPDWLDEHLVPRAKELGAKINTLEAEKSQYDDLAYVLYGTGGQLEDSVALLLRKLGLNVDPQAKGANIDLKAVHPALNLGFAVEVTGTKGTIQKDSNKISQAWQYISERSGASEEDDRLVIVANTENHLDPRLRTRDSFSPDAVKLLSNNGVLLITTLQLYELWKSVEEGNRTPDDVVRELHGKVGLYR